MRYFICLLFLALPAFAQEELVDIYSPLLAQCYEDADGSEAKQQCIGALSGACMSEEDGGETTLGMSMCNNAEAEYWDKLLNEEYRETMVWAKASDQDDQEYFPGFANRANALRDAQRAWIAFRDAECALDYAVWGAGSMRHIAGTGCIMTLTAERTIQLRQKRGFFE